MYKELMIVSTMLIQYYNDIYDCSLSWLGTDTLIKKKVAVLI